jgi:hypothetical protein
MWAVANDSLGGNSNSTPPASSTVGLSVVSSSADNKLLNAGSVNGVAVS